MSKEVFEQQFAQAKQLFGQGRYDESLTLLKAINIECPNIFNIQFPILQCLQRLGRVAEAREWHDTIQGAFTDPRQQTRINDIGAWLLSEENKITFGDDLPVVGLDLLDDMFDKPKPKKVAPPPKKSFSLSFPDQKKSLIVVGAILVLVVAGYLGFNVVIKAMFSPPEFSADIALKLPYDTFNGKIYFRNTKLIRTELMGKVFLFQNDLRYALLPDSQNYAVLSTANAGPLDSFGGISLRNLKNVGQEVMQGHDCTIYETEVSAQPGAPKTTTKFWYAKKIRLPIQIENTMPGLIGRITITLQNINIGPLNDSLFEIPAGYTRSPDSPTMMELIMDMPSSGTPSAPPPPVSPVPAGSNVPDNAANMSNPDLGNILKQLRNQ